jgi:hypothetical protein
VALDLRRREVNILSHKNIFFEEPTKLPRKKHNTNDPQKHLLSNFTLHVTENRREYVFHNNAYKEGNNVQRCHQRRMENQCFSTKLLDGMGPLDNASNEGRAINC